MSEYETYFESLQSNTFDCFDVLSFTESWLDDTLQQLAVLENYKPVFKHKVGKKEGGGIAINVKNTIKYICRPDLSMPHDQQHKFDCLFIEISPETFSRNIIVGIVYRSPSYDSIADFSKCSIT